MHPLTALEILRAAAERSGRETVKTREVRAALRTLKPRCPERWPLDTFWEFASEEHPVGRSQNVRRALNGILVQLGLPTE